MSASDQPIPDETPASSLVSRRKVLGGLAVGTAALGVPTVAAAQAPPRRRGGRGRGPDGPDGRRGEGRGDGRGDANALGQGGGNPVDDEVLGALQTAGPDQFSRLFPRAAFREVDDELRVQMAALGAPGGLIDAKDALDEGPIRLITEPELSLNNPNNTTHTAGTTFVGQFLDHDITSDGGSRLGQPTPVQRSVNLRSARFDLDSVYGGGPAVSRELYTDDDPFRFRIGDGGQFEDLPRNADGSAIIADPRNDENLIIAGIQVAMLKFHNAVLERVRSSGLTGEMAYREAQRLVIWHWQWLIVHQFLPQFVGQTMVDDILGNGRRFYTPSRAQIPVEFQTSAYRFGHSMIRPSYRANMAGDQGEPFFGMVFDPSQFGAADPDDMSGGVRAPRRFIGWQTFFDFDDGEVKPNKKIDTHISTPLFQLPMGAIATSRGEPIGPLSLPTRNLLRHITWQIASGEDVAAAMGEERLALADLADIAAVAPLLEGRTPLWLYVLREADLMAGGDHLGPVGGRIVAEVFLGLLSMDPSSYFRVPDWRPTLPSVAGAGNYRMVDLLTMAGVDPASRGQ
ncbi:MAG: peroxidase family protein [Actinomycetota bacterium]